MTLLSDNSCTHRQMHACSNSNSTGTVAGVKVIAPYLNFGLSEILLIQKFSFKNAIFGTERPQSQKS